MIRRPGRAGPAVLALWLAVSGAACSASTGSPSQQMSAWSRTTGARALLANLGTDLTNALGHLRGADRTTAHTLCAILSTDAQSANDDLPTPNKAFTDQLAATYTSLYDAAQDCYHGAGNAALTTRAAAELESASAQLERASATLSRLGG
ncbi:MAG TPA: hypothetical protein VE990_14365 [Acidimicrobiales bacterium]|nr:hypothetical protein [Acidimicrobiales bacterium]